MKTSVYDRVTAMLIALLILIGSIVAVLFGLWLSTQVLSRPRAVPVTLVPRGGDGGGMQDCDVTDPNVIDPGTDVDRDEPALVDSLDSVVDLISKNSAVFSRSSPFDDALLIPGGKQGDGRTAGNGTGLAGRPRRWEVHFDKGLTADEYAVMLDSFGIELGVLRPGGKIVYVSNLSAAKPTVRTGNSIDEKRYYLTWVKGDTENADREILAKAGVPQNGRLLLKFLPQKMESTLETLEKDYAGDRVKEIRATFFRIARIDSEYRVLILSQVYR